MQKEISNLHIWQKGMVLAKDIYTFTKSFPKEEVYGLVSQMRRAAVSIPANIAEGKGRSHKKEFVQFLNVAQGSLYELMTLVRLAGDVGCADGERSRELIQQCQELSGMLHAFINSLQR